MLLTNNDRAHCKKKVSGSGEKTARNEKRKATARTLRGPVLTYYVNFVLCRFLFSF